ncbi:MAG: DUF3078 domain-containing protein [Cyclobacteriaceae bacterium]|nr:DUF3078 domain-containing protein [Cyclobacteriaceae bacterium]
MKKMLMIIVLQSLVLSAIGQVTEIEAKLKPKPVAPDTIQGWKKGGTITTNFSQVSLTNWASGGQNSLALNGLLSLFGHYKKGKGNWENYLDIAYGTIRQGKKSNWWKSDDKIDFTSKYGRRATGDWYLAGVLNFKTQMADGFNYPNDSLVISKLMAPGYLLGALGMDYKPNDKFTMFFAPLTSKTTFVSDRELANAGNFGVTPAVYDTAGNVITPGKNVRGEFGGYIRIFYKRDIVENITLQTKLDLFSNYLHNPQNIDVNWETLISMKVNKYISATLSTHLLYDDDIDIAFDSNNDGVKDKKGPRTQFKEALGVGFSYKF